MTLEEFLNVLNTDPDYKEDFAEWVRSGIHGNDDLPYKRWDEIFDDFAGTFDEEDEEEITEFEVAVNDGDKIIKVWKDGGKWIASGGRQFMGYLKPKDVVEWLRKDFGPAWLAESTLDQVEKSKVFKIILKEARRDRNVHDDANKLWGRLKDFLEGELRKIDVIANSDPEPRSYRVLEDGPNRYAVDISIKGRYYDEVFIHIYSPLIGSTGVYVITSLKDDKEVIWHGIDVEEFTNDLKDCFFKVWNLY